MIDSNEDSEGISFYLELETSYTTNEKLKPPHVVLNTTKQLWQPVAKDDLCSPICRKWANQAIVACFDISLSDSSTDVQEYGWVPTPDGAFHESLEKQELFLSNANLKIG
jgi:hypothetical protein